jgi:hypothetical protein
MWKEKEMQQIWINERCFEIMVTRHITMKWM